MADEQQTQAEPQATEEVASLEIDPAKFDQLISELRTHQSLPMGIAGGMIGAVVGAAVWAGITVATGYQIGFMAIGVGFLVGLVVRSLGKGLDKSFGVVGAVFALVGCLAGNLLSGCGFAAANQQMPFIDVVTSLTPTIAGDILTVMFSPIDLLFYGIAIYEGYRFSIRHVTHEELAALADQSTNDPAQSPE